MPVSYTHLDVYKRQVDHRMHLGTRLGRLALLVGEAHVAVLDRALRHLCLLYTSTTARGALRLSLASNVTDEDIALLSERIPTCI